VAIEPLYGIRRQDIVHANMQRGGDLSQQADGWLALAAFDLADGRWG
jgi:hypothetical protein